MRPSRPRRRGLWIAFGIGLPAAIGLTWIAWLLAFGWAQETGRLERWVNRRPERVLVSWSTARSPFPGWIELDDLRVVGRSPNRRWEITAERASGALVLVAFARRELRFVGAQAHGVEVRVARHAAPDPIDLAESPAPDPPGADAPDPGPLPGAAQGESPQIDGLPEGPPPALDPARPAWSFTFRFSRIEDLREVWVDDRRFHGSASGSGGFALHRRTLAEVTDSDLRFTGVTLSAGGSPVATALDGRIDLRIFPWRYRGAKLVEVVREIEGELDLAGEIEPAEIVDYLFSGWPWLALESRTSRAEAHLSLSRGEVLGGSSVRVVNPRQTVRLFGLEALGDAELTAVASPTWGDVRLTTALRLGHWQLGLPGAPPLALGEGLRLEVAADEPRIDAPPRAADLELDLGRATVPDLRFLNDLLPAAAIVKVDQGTADLSGKLAFATASGSGGGAVRLHGTGLRLAIGEERLSGNLEVDLKLAEAEFPGPTFSIAGSKLALLGFVAESPAGENLAGWWAEVATPSGRVELGPAFGIRGQFDSRLADSRPLVALYEVRRDLPEWAERLLTVQAVSLVGGFDWRKGRFQLQDAFVPLAHGEARATFDLDREHRRGRLLLVWRRLEVGIDIDGTERTLKLRDAREWYASPPPPAAAATGAAE